MIIASLRLARSGPLGHVLFEIFEVEVQLLNRESECKETFRRAPGRARVRPSLGAWRSRRHRHRAPYSTALRDGGPRRAGSAIRTGAQIIGEGDPGTRQRRLEPRSEGFGQWNDDRSPDHHKVVAQSEQRAQQRLGVGPYREPLPTVRARPRAHHIHLRQGLSDAVLNAGDRIRRRSPA